MVHSGGFEIVVTSLLVVTMFYAMGQGLIPRSSLIIDLAACAVVIVAQRWLRVGMAASFAVIAAVLVIDPYAVGMALYLCILPVITAIRKEKFPLAIVSTIVNATAGTVVSLRISGDDRDLAGALLSWTFLYALAWAIGLGMRAIARVEAARVRAEFRERELALAWELHESVASNLALLSKRVKAAQQVGSLSADDLDAVVEQTHLAGQSVREISQLLGGWERTPLPDVSLRSAVTEGMRDLRQRGFTVQASVEIPELPPEVDRVAGRIVHEAMHNVGAHGSPTAPCVVMVRVGPEALELSVTNRIKDFNGEIVPGLGMTSMRYRTDALGGDFSAQRVRGTWVCKASLPLR